MAYIDGFLASAPAGNKQAYLDMATKAAAIFREYGATRIVETWGDDVPDGKQTDMKRAVQATADEIVIFSWIEWPDKATRDAGMAKMRTDKRMKPDGAPPFDMKRMIYGGFEPILDA